MVHGIRFRRLVLRGLNRDYGPVLLRDGEPTGLAIIAGEISTGKSTILEFIDFCLGASRHPTHPELIEVSIRTALLEVEVNGESCVIERGVLPAAGNATIHWTDLDGLMEPHERQVRPIRPPGDPESLSSFLLDTVGLVGVQLKEAPTQVASGLDPLSFRDLMAVCFIENDRLGSSRLLHESDRMRALKLTQVIDVIFGVHEDALTELSGAIGATEARRETVAREVATLTAFLNQREVGGEAELAARRDEIESELHAVLAQLASIDVDLRSQTTVADRLRERYEEAVQRRSHADAVVRDRETLLSRLRVLRGQYAADLARLSFSVDSERLFNELQVVVCPACHAELGTTPSIDEGRCTLCGQLIASAQAADIDLTHEISATKARLDELTAYMASIADEIGQVRASLVAAEAAEGAVRSELDAATAAAVAPFLSQRDSLQSRQRDLVSERAAVDHALQIRAGLTDREGQRDRLSRELDELRERHARQSEAHRTRDDVVDQLSERFASLLGVFGLHKLTEAHLDGRYAPHVRNRRYSDLSSGARTLTAIAWSLAILEVAMEGGHQHPGFLVLDGLQKNLTPADERPDPEVETRDIVDRVYEHLIQWTSAAGRDAQVLIVDNRPPHRADPAVVVRYTSDPARPPFGLIEDAIR